MLRLSLIFLGAIFFFGCSTIRQDQDNPCCKKSEKPETKLSSKADLIKFIRNELESNNLSLIYLGIPKVESNFKVDSRFDGCAGIWQFKKTTAKALGLKVNEIVDERFDVQKSTKAAIRYLKYLEAKFLHPEYVLAAYNWGEGKVFQALKQNRPFPKKVLNYIVKVKRAAEVLV